MIPDAGPDVSCCVAVTAAAQSRGTTSDAVLSADRHRAVTDARAVAMTAARRGGVILPAIAAHFGKDHTTVMYAQRKVASNPRLNAVCTCVGDQLEDHYALPMSTRTPGAREAIKVTSGSSEVLQLASLDETRNNRPHRRHEDESQQPTISTPADR